MGVDYWNDDLNVNLQLMSLVYWFQCNAMQCVCDDFKMCFSFLCSAVSHQLNNYQNIQEELNF